MKAREVEGIVFNLADLAQYLNQLTDPRDQRGKVYELGTILSMIVLARLSGQEKPHGVFKWIRDQQEAFEKMFSLKRRQTPCLNTLPTILAEVVFLLAKHLVGILLAYFVLSPLLLTNLMGVLRNEF